MKRQIKRKPFKIKRPGALTRKAKHAGLTVNQYARRHINSPGLTGKQARFYIYVLKRPSK